MSAESSEPPGGVERRRGERRRTYNRRSTDREISPPYFETFERIAIALEHIEELLRTRAIVLPESATQQHVDR